MGHILFTLFNYIGSKYDIQTLRRHLIKYMLAPCIHILFVQFSFNTLETENLRLRKIIDTRPDKGLMTFTDKKKLLNF